MGFYIVSRKGDSLLHEWDGADMPNYKQGSIWRRWDLHLHTPETALEDGYNGDWNGFYAAIEVKH